MTEIAESTALSALFDEPIGHAPRGRRPGPKPTVVVMRELDEGDLPLIREPPYYGNKGVPAIQRLRHHHHHMARLLAEGRRVIEVAAITGFTPVRINQLRQSPAFQELEAYYVSQKEALYLDVHQRLATLGITTIEELQQRLEEEPEKFSNAELRQLMAETLERSAAPAKGTKGQAPGAGGVPAININFIGGQEPSVEPKPMRQPDAIEGEIIED